MTFFLFWYQQRTNDETVLKNDEQKKRKGKIRKLHNFKEKVMQNKIIFF